MKFSTNCAIFS